MTLTVVLAVMNGFQLGFIESIVEISSYHLQVHPDRLEPGTEARDLEPPVIESLRGIPRVTALVPFVQRQALIEGAFQRPRVCVGARGAAGPVRSRPGPGADAVPGRRHVRRRTSARDRPGNRARGGSGGAGRRRALPQLVRDRRRRQARAPTRQLRPHAGLSTRATTISTPALVFISLATADALYGGGSGLCRGPGASRSPTASTTRARCGRHPALLRGTGFTVGKLAVVQQVLLRRAVRGEAHDDDPRRAHLPRRGLQRLSLTAPERARADGGDRRAEGGRRPAAAHPVDLHPRRGCSSGLPAAASACCAGLAPVGERERGVRRRRARRECRDDARPGASHFAFASGGSGGSSRSSPRRTST